MIVLALTKIDQQEIPEKSMLQKLTVVVKSVKDSARKSTRRYTLYFKQPSKYFYGSVLLRSHQVIQEISDIKPGMELEVLVKQEKNLQLQYGKYQTIKKLSLVMKSWLSHWYLVKIERAKNA